MKFTLIKIHLDLRAVLLGMLILLGFALSAAAETGSANGKTLQVGERSGGRFIKPKDGVRVARTIVPPQFGEMKRHFQKPPIPKEKLLTTVSKGTSFCLMPHLLIIWMQASMPPGCGKTEVKIRTKKTTIGSFRNGKDVVLILRIDFNLKESFGRMTAMSAFILRKKEDEDDVF